MISSRAVETGGHRVAPTTGLILVDGSGRPQYFNCEAVKVLAYPRPGIHPEKISDVLPWEIQSVLLAPSVRSSSSATQFTSGRRRYLCRVFVLNPSSATRSGGMTALLLERDSSKAPNFSEVAERFHLTLREREMVGLLTLGLTSKEIAGRMKISPNTVKTFFRLVMTKMGVSTRAGVVGKIVRMPAATSRL